MVYSATDTEKEWMFSIFAQMPKDVFIEELSALRSAYDLYFIGSTKLVDSFVLEYISDVYEIIRDVLVCRCLDSDNEELSV